MLATSIHADVNVQIQSF